MVLSSALTVNTMNKTIIEQIERLIEETYNADTNNWRDCLISIRDGAFSIKSNVEKLELEINNISKGISRNNG